MPTKRVWMKHSSFSIYIIYVTCWHIRVNILIAVKSMMTLAFLLPQSYISGTSQIKNSYLR